MGSSPAQLISILTASIGPVIVISGIGLLLLSMTNRYGRVIDRARELVKDLDAFTDNPRHVSLCKQLEITYQRARILRAAILASALAILFVALTVILLFVEQLLNIEVDLFSVPCFGLSLASLVGSLFHFVRDVQISLDALKLEMAPHVTPNRERQ